MKTDSLTPPSPAQRMHARMQAVLSQIDRQPEAALNLQALSALAASSPCHFHRQFRALLGMPLARYVLMSRMQRAVAWLLHRPQLTVLEIALACGYESPESLSRVFRRELGLTPSALRRSARQPDWPALAQFQALTENFHAMMNSSPSSDAADFQDQVRILPQQPAIPIALLIHQGPPANLPQSLQRFRDWRRENGLPPSRSATYNILFDDPEQVDPQLWRIGLGAGLPEGHRGELAGNSQGLEASELAAGRWACLSHQGTDAALFDKVLRLYRDWLPASGETLRDLPPVIRRISMEPDVPSQEAQSEIWMPLR
ncbi:AraC family transcriptional regulator [Paucibacter sp. KBW04]|uniref:AraC family transcriptional regulator n=1 Tax=Paucibacter sp. KBW04 TaxID=2153361 RepID=UPI000F5815C1|nr:GyrI-like domain-containing protein [Paucibacter sp. KBW04]RQO54773.1 AraC family transcriptional regulator [Paucibacter sp. KBW04]